MKTLYTTILVILLVFPGTLSAGEGDKPKDNSVGEIIAFGGFHSRMVTDSTWDLFSSDDWSPGVSVGLEYEVIKDLFVMAGYSFFTQKGWVYRESTETQIKMHEPLIGVRKGLSFFEAIRPYAALVATLSVAKARQESTAAPGHLEQDKLLIGGRAGLGCELFFPSRVFGASRSAKKKAGRFTMGMALEAGYYIRQPWELDGLKPTEDGSDKDLDLDGLTMGNLNLTGSGGALWTHGLYINVDFRFYF